MAAAIEALIVELQARGNVVDGTAATATNRVGDAAVSAQGKTRNLAKSQKDLSDAAGVVTDHMRKQANELRNMIAGTVGVTAAVYALKTALQTFSDFEYRMSAAGAVSRATSDEMAAMTEAAKELGRTTIFSSSQAAAGMEFLGRAGFKTSDIIGSMPALLDLAAAGALDLGEAADITSNIMSAFNVEAERSGEVADKLALAAASSNINVSQLGQAIKYVGPVAAALGVSLSETTAAIGLLGNVGLGDVAGRGLRSVVSSLVNVTKDGQKALAEMGLTAGDISPEVNGLAGAFETLRKAQLNAEQAFRLFGNEGASVALALTASSSQLKTFTGELDASAGSAKTMADRMSDNLRGSVLELESVIESLAIDFGTALSPALREGTDSLREFLTSHQDDIIAFGEAMGSAVRGVTGLFGFVVEHSDAVLTALAAIAAAAIAIEFGPAILSANAWVGALTASQLAGVLAIGAMEGLEIAFVAVSAKINAMTAAVAANPLLVGGAVILGALLLINKGITDWADQSVADINRVVEASNKVREAWDQTAKAIEENTASSVRAQRIAIEQQIAAEDMRLAGLRRDLAIEEQHYKSLNVANYQRLPVIQQLSEAVKNQEMVVQGLEVQQLKLNKVSERFADIAGKDMASSLDELRAKARELGPEGESLIAQIDEFERSLNKVPPAAEHVVTAMEKLQAEALKNDLISEAVTKYNLSLEASTKIIGAMIEAQEDAGVKGLAAAQAVRSLLNQSGNATVEAMVAIGRQIDANTEKVERLKEAMALGAEQGQADFRDAMSAIFGAFAAQPTDPNDIDAGLLDQIGPDQQKMTEMTRELKREQKEYNKELEKTSDQWHYTADAIADAIALTNSSLGDVVSGLTDAAHAWIEYAKAVKSGDEAAAESAKNSAYAAIAATAISLGNQDEGTRSGEFATYGQIIGSFWGAGGAAIGAALGAAIGHFVKIAEQEAEGSINVALGELHANADISGSKLARGLSQYMESIMDALDAVAATFGAEFAEGFNLDLSIARPRRLDDDQFYVELDGYFGQTFDNLADATAFAVAHAVRTHQFSGLSPEAQALLSEFGIDTATELQTAMARAVRLERARIGDIAFETRAVFTTLFDDVKAAITAGLDPEIAFASLSNSLQEMRDQLTGNVRTEAEVYEQRRIAYNAELVILRTKLQLMLMELQLLEEQNSARRYGITGIGGIGGGGNAGASGTREGTVGEQIWSLRQHKSGVSTQIAQQAEDLARAAESVLVAGAKIGESTGAMAAGAAASAAAAGAAAGSMAAGAASMAAGATATAAGSSIAAAAATTATSTTSELAASLQALIDSLPGLISPEELRPGGNRAGAEQRADRRQQFWDELRRANAELAGVSQSVLDYRDAVAAIDRGIQEAREAGIAEARLAELRGAHIELLRRDFIATYQQILDDAAENPFQQIARDYTDALALIHEMSGPAGPDKPAVELPTEFTDAFAEQVMSAFTDELERLTAAGDQQGILDLFDQLQNMELPPELQELLSTLLPEAAQAVAVALGEIHDAMVSSLDEDLVARRDAYESTGEFTIALRDLDTEMADLRHRTNEAYDGMSQLGERLAELNRLQRHATTGLGIDFFGSLLDLGEITPELAQLNQQLRIAQLAYAQAMAISDAIALHAAGAFDLMGMSLEDVIGLVNSSFGAAIANAMKPTQINTSSSYSGSFSSTASSVDRLADALKAARQQTEDWLGYGIDPLQKELSGMVDRFAELRDTVINAGGHMSDLVDLEQALMVARQAALDTLLDSVRDAIDTSVRTDPGLLAPNRLAMLQSQFQEAVANAQANPGQQSVQQAVELFDQLSQFGQQYFTGASLSGFLSDLRAQLGELLGITLPEPEIPPVELIKQQLEKSLPHLETIDTSTQQSLLGILEQNPILAAMLGVSIDQIPRLAEILGVTNDELITALAANPLLAEIVSGLGEQLPILANMLGIEDSQLLQYLQMHPVLQDQLAALIRSGDVTELGLQNVVDSVNNVESALNKPLIIDENSNINKVQDLVGFSTEAMQQITLSAIQSMASGITMGFSKVSDGLTLIVGELRNLRDDVEELTDEVVTLRRAVESGGKLAGAA